MKLLSSEPDLSMFDLVSEVVELFGWFVVSAIWSRAELYPSLQSCSESWFRGQRIYLTAVSLSAAKCAYVTVTSLLQTPIHVQA